MKIFALITLTILMALPALADQRDMNTLPMLTPDPSLKTTDSFYANKGCEYMGASEVSGILLPPVFGGPMPTATPEQPAWMNLTEHNEKLNSSTRYITAIDSYALTEEQMVRANVTMGDESWL
jgi:hypothetical protein